MRRAQDGEIGAGDGAFMSQDFVDGPIPTGDLEQGRDCLSIKAHAQNARRISGDDGIIRHMARGHRVDSDDHVGVDMGVGFGRKIGRVGDEAIRVINRETVGRKPIHLVIGRLGDEPDTVGKLPELSDHQTIWRHRKKIGGDPSRPIGQDLGWIERELYT